MDVEGGVGQLADSVGQVLDGEVGGSTDVRIPPFVGTTNVEHRRAGGAENAPQLWEVDHVAIPPDAAAAGRSMPMRVIDRCASATCCGVSARRVIGVPHGTSQPR